MAYLALCLTLLNQNSQVGMRQMPTLIGSNSSYSQVGYSHINRLCIHQLVCSNAREAKSHNRGIKHP